MAGRPAVVEGPGPDLIFPVDQSWLLSRLWDDDWRCFGGPGSLVDNLLKEHRLEVRRVALDEDATPPGHVARSTEFAPARRPEREFRQ